ncbi:hypothetical protein PVK06_048518 [Gossypium arboreum]|uniref:Uncharacterized protein n=1 Tax=Gossypium arboreum TaxID=29729 RepID=A0ABR0MGH4_GOSAR|nr:hypothetical protein PVK06_048518 [Gossypium arboreum]
MAHPSFGDQHNETDLFTEWFIDKSKNLGNMVYQGEYDPLDLNISTNQGLPLPPNQEEPPQQFLALQKQIRFIKELMATQEAHFE